MLCKRLAKEGHSSVQGYHQVEKRCHVIARANVKSDRKHTEKQAKITNDTVEDNFDFSKHCTAQLIEKKIFPSEKQTIVNFSMAFVWHCFAHIFIERSVSTRPFLSILKTTASSLEHGNLWHVIDSSVRNAKLPSGIFSNLNFTRPGNNLFSQNDEVYCLLK